MVVAAPAAGMAAGLIAGTPGFGHWTWALARSAGVLAYLVLTASVLLGLGVGGRLAKSRWLPTIADMHSLAAALVLTLLAVHAGALLLDSYRPFSPAAVTVPLAARYREPWTSAGVAGAWLAIVIAASFWLRSRTHPTLWRRLHVLALPAWLLSLMHGLGAGTDASEGWLYWTYVLSAATMAALVTWRLGSAGLPASQAGRARRRSFTPQSP